MNNIKKIKICVITAVLILLLNIGSTVTPLLIKAQTITSGYKLKVDYNDEGYATISADASQVTSGYQLVSLTDKDDKDVSDDPANFSQKVTKDGIYTYTLNYTLKGIAEQQAQSEEVTVKVEGIEKNDTPEDTKTYQITNNFNANNDYQDVTINPQKDVTAGQKVTVSFTWPQTVESITTPKITGADGQDLTASVDVTNIKNDATTRQYEFTFTMPAQDVSLNLETTQVTNKVELDGTTYQPIYTQTSTNIQDTKQADIWGNKAQSITIWANFKYGTGDNTAYKEAKAAGKIYYAVYRKDNSTNSQYQLLWGSKDGDDTSGGTSGTDSRVTVSGLLATDLNQNGNFWLSITVKGLTGNDHGSSYRIVAFTDANNTGVSVGSDNTLNYPQTLTDDFLAKVPSVTNDVKVLVPFNQDGQMPSRYLVNAGQYFNLVFYVTAEGTNYTQDELNYLINNYKIKFVFAKDYQDGRKPIVWAFSDNDWKIYKPYGYTAVGVRYQDGFKTTPKVVPTSTPGKYKVIFAETAESYTKGMSLNEDQNSVFYAYCWNTANSTESSLKNWGGSSSTGIPVVANQDKVNGHGGSSADTYVLWNKDAKVTVPGGKVTVYLLNKPDQNTYQSAYGGTITYPSAIKVVNDNGKIKSEEKTVALHLVYTDSSGVHTDEGDMTVTNPDIGHEYDFKVSFGGGDVTVQPNNTQLTLTQQTRQSTDNPGKVNVDIVSGNGEKLNDGVLGTLKFASNNEGTAVDKLTYRLEGTYNPASFSSPLPFSGSLGYIFERVNVAS